MSADVEALRAEVAELTARLDGALRVIGLVYDQGFADAIGTPDSNATAARTAYRLGIEAGKRLAGLGERIAQAGGLTTSPRQRPRHLRSIQ
jgi:predicted RNA polymerase sigma factor